MSATHPKTGKNKAKRQTKSSRAGLVFPVGRIDKSLKTGLYSKRVGIGAPVYLAAVLEYICAEVLEMAGEFATNNNKQRITRRHIQLAIHSDAEIDQVFRHTTIASGGVIPHIHSALLPKSKVKDSECENPKKKSKSKN